MATDELIYREEVLAIIGALADLVVHVSDIRAILDEEYGDEEAD